jgi:hypothetical protein
MSESVVRSSVLARDRLGYPLLPQVNASVDLPYLPRAESWEKRYSSLEPIGPMSGCRLESIGLLRSKGWKLGNE